MATQSQIDANRRNAQKSTGPTTPEGRDAVRHNALKHGLTSEVLIPMDEDRPEFDRICDSFETEYQPVGSGPMLCWLNIQLHISGGGGILWRELSAYDDLTCAQLSFWLAYAKVSSALDSSRGAKRCQQRN
jgi:hypothetical protein